MRKDFVVVGERLGVIEEFIPSGAVYVSEDGALRALAVGVATFDPLRHTVKVVPAKAGTAISVGDEVLAFVTKITAYASIVNIFAVNKKVLRYPVTAQVPLKRNRHRLVEGEVIVAKVTSTRNGVFLTIEEEGLGVIIGRCSGCGSPVAGGKRFYTCKRCGARGYKKFSSRELSEVLRL